MTKEKQEKRNIGSSQRKEERAQSRNVSLALTQTTEQLFHSAPDKVFASCTTGRANFILKYSDVNLARLVTS